MAEDTPPPETTEHIPDVSDSDRRLIIAFVICILAGLGVLGWHYHSSDTAAPLCATPDAHCGDKTDPGAP